MFRGFRDGRFAIGLVLGIGLTILFVLSTHGAAKFVKHDIRGVTSSQGRTDASGDESSHDEQEPDWVFVARSLVRLEDTIAQWLMLLFSIAATILLWRTLGTTTETIRLMRNEQRPWVDFKVSNGKVTCKPRKDQDPEVTISIEITAENFGTSPAIDVSSLSGISTHGTLIVGRDVYARFLNEHLRKDWAGRSVVFPGRSTSDIEQWFLLADRQAVDPMAQTPPVHVAVPVESWRLIVCLFYRSGNGEKHFTCKTYDVHPPQECLTKRTAHLNLGSGLKPGEIGKPYNQIYG